MTFVFVFSLHYGRFLRCECILDLVMVLIPCRILFVSSLVKNKSGRTESMTAVVVPLCVTTALFTLRGNCRCGLTCAMSDAEFPLYIRWTTHLVMRARARRPGRISSVLMAPIKGWCDRVIALAYVNNVNQCRRESSVGNQPSRAYGNSMHKA